MAADEPFLRRLDAAVRKARLGDLGPALLDQQYAARRRARARAEELVIEVGGTPVGALCVQRPPGGPQCLLDLALLPDHRGRGHGAQAVRLALDPRCDAQVDVERTNLAALRFYERLGFAAAGGDAVHLRLRRVARPATD